MSRRVGVVIVSVALTFAGLAAGTGSAGAYGTKKVAAAGSIACDWTSGLIKLKPRFVNGGTTPAQVKFKGEVGNCRDASGENGPVPFGITGGKVKGSFSTPSNACTSGAPVAGGASTVRIKWTGSQKVKPSVFSSGDSGYQFDANGTFFSLPSDAIPNGSGAVTGSFEGDAAVVFGDSAMVGGAVQIACLPKGGIKGSGGLRALELDTTLALLFTA